MMEYKILHIEDSVTDADIVKRVLQKSGMQLCYHVATNKEELQQELMTFEPDIVLCDHSLPSFNSKKAFVLCKEKRADLPFILVTGTVSEEFAVEMLKLGIDDYLLKTNLQRLPSAITNALTKSETEKKVQAYRLELQKSEAQLRTIFESSSTGLLLIDKDFIVIESNSLMAKVTALTFGHRYQKNENLLDSLPPERIEKLKNNIEKVINGEVISYEAFYKADDSTTITFLVNMNPVNNAAGKTEGVCISITDITKQKKTEQTIRESEEKYRSLIEQASDAILVYSFDGTIHEFNKSCYTMLGYSKEEYAKLRLTDILVDDIIVNQENYAAILAGETKTLNRKLMRKDGSLLETEVTVKMLADGKAIAFARDITERKKAEETIKKERDLSDSVINSLPGVFYLLDENIKFLRWNKNFETVTGYNAEEIVNMSPVDFFDADQKVSIAKQISNLLLKGEVYTEANFCTKGNIKIPHYFAAHKISIGGKIHLLGTGLDITERKAAEEVVKRSNERFKLIGQATNDAVWEWNLETGELWGNDTHQQLYGLTITDFVPNDIEWKKRLHPEDRQQTLKDIEKTMSSESNIWSGEYRLYTENKGWVYIYGQTYIVRDESGKAARLLGNMMDITDRKKSEETIRAAIERYDILAKATSDTIWDWDIVNNTMLYNDGISKVFGYEKSEVENVIDWWHEKLHPEDFNKVTELLADVFENGLQNFQSTYRFRCADNSFKYIFDRAFVIFDDAGTPVRMIGDMQDITYQVEEDIRVAKAIIDAQEEERNKLGAELHDNINQILAGTLLTLGLAKTKEIDGPQRAEFINTAIGCITQAVDETRKLSHSLAPANFEENSLKDLFENLLFNLNLENQFSVRLDFDELKEKVIPENIQVNLYRILQEQTKNILKYSEASTIEIDIKIIDKSVRLRIYDNGKGFDTKAKRTGIGLSNIKKRAQSLLGKFILNSAPGKGCEIIVEIPLVI